MQQVIELVERGDHHEALVRLWVLATKRANPDDDLPLNAWERASQRVLRSRSASRIRAALQDGRHVGAAVVDVDPLALVLALDEFLGLDTPRVRAFVDEPYRVDSAAYWLLPLNLTRASAASSARQAGNPHSWFRHHRVVPATLPGGLRVEPRPSRDVTDLRLRDMKHAGRMRALIGHFADGAVLDPPPEQRFFSTGLSDEAGRAASIERLLARAAGDNVEVVLLPELTVTPAQREQVKNRLSQMDAAGHSLVVVVAGSFHETRDGRKVNAAELLGSDGRRLIAQEKLRPYGFADGLAEDIHAANALGLLVTPIGSIAVTICKDYCDELGPIDAWASVAVDWWLVPSMGERSTIDAHLRRAAMLWKVLNRAVTLVANQEPGIVREVAEPLPGFAFDGQRLDIPVGGGVVVVAVDVAVQRHLRRIN